MKISQFEDLKMRIVLSFSLVVVISTSSVSQVSFGVKGGLNLTKTLEIREIVFFDFSERIVGTVTEQNRAIQFGIGYKIK